MNGRLARWIDEATSELVARFSRPHRTYTTDPTDLALYLRPEFQDPANLFPLPATPEVTETPVQSTRLWDVTEYAFPSPHQPLSERYAAQYATYTADHVVRGRRYRLREASPGAPTLIYIHGWREPSLSLEQGRLLTRMARRLGCHIVTMMQPFHMRRAPQGTYSGELFLNGDMVYMIEAFRQAVGDARAILSWREAAGDGPVGLLGISLGGFVSSLVAASDARPAFVIIGLAHGSLNQGGEGARLIRHVRPGLEAGGLSPQDWSRVPVVARQMRPLVPAERILMFNGRYDTVCRAEDAEALRAAWGLGPIAWYPGGHMAFPLYLSSVLEGCAAFLAGLGLLPA